MDTIILRTPWSLLSCINTDKCVTALAVSWDKQRDQLNLVVRQILETLSRLNTMTQRNKWNLNFINKCADERAQDDERPNVAEGNNDIESLTQHHSDNDVLSDDENNRGNDNVDEKSTAQSNVTNIVNTATTSTIDPLGESSISKL